MISILQMRELQIKDIKKNSKPAKGYRSRNQNQVNFTANSFWRRDSRPDSVTAHKQHPLNGGGMNGSSSKSEAFFCIITPAYPKEIFIKSHASQNINTHGAANQQPTCEAKVSFFKNANNPERVQDKSYIFTSYRLLNSLFREREKSPEQSQKDRNI